MAISYTTVVDHLVFGEGPRWHDEMLWFSDMFAGRVHRFNPLSGSVETVLELDDRPSGIGWLPDGRMLVVAMEQRQLLRIEAGRPVVHADLRDLVTGDANDMVVDRDGRAYVGNFGRGFSEGAEVEATNLVIVEADGTARRGPGDLLFPNGMVISPDGQRLIVAEGSRQVLTEFRIVPEGDLVERQTFAPLDGETPDGIALDAAGGVWVALPLKQEFVRVEQGGNVTSRIPVAPRGAFACALGGRDRRTLFMCATLGGPEQIQARTSEGVILAAEVDVPGAGWP